jgi:hypothetical protein
MKKKACGLALILFLGLGLLRAEPVSFQDLTGRWQLMYRGNYGYEFRFFRNYQAVCILYLSTNALVFKGIYNIEAGRKIRINIYQMKNEENVSGINLNRNFVKAASSYFEFKVDMEKTKKEKVLVLTPERIIIDGNNSDGYFEPVIRLKR